MSDAVSDAVSDARPQAAAPVPDAPVPPGPAAGPGTLVCRETPLGPDFTGRRAPRRRLRRDTLVPLLDRPRRLAIALLSVAWVVAAVDFWRWLLRPEHLLDWPRTALNAAVLGHLCLLPVSFVVAANRLRGVDPRLPVPALRTAFVVTRAPSEPWPLARTTLTAMLGQRFPHPYDVWLCDEEPTAEIRRWCAEHGVQLSTRAGRPDYHRQEWPRRTRCKEGNLAHFYDHWGYRDYDVVAQLDCDHVPGPDYLAEMVRPFGDPAVGYVAAPSVCDSNADRSWAARGRLFREAGFHGPVQVGHHGLGPVCIGSHYAVRTAALREIGGLGPELAEDFSTSFLLCSAGWQGAFAHRARASGEGPLTLAAMLTQEFQWARSLVLLLLGLVPRHLGRLPGTLRLRFLTALGYYPLLTLATAGGLLLPAVAAVTGTPFLQVNYVEFLLHWLALPACLIPVAAILRWSGLSRPSHAPLLSWESWLYLMARWPYVARGVVAGVRQWLRPVPVTFAVTPKRRDGVEALPTALIAPYLVVAAALSAAAVAGERRLQAVGYVFLCLLGASGHALVALAVTWLHAVEAARENGTSRLAALRRTALAPAAGAAATLVPLLWAWATYPGYAASAL